VSVGRKDTCGAAGIGSGSDGAHRACLPVRLQVQLMKKFEQHSRRLSLKTDPCTDTPSTARPKLRERKRTSAWALSVAIVGDSITLPVDVLAAELARRYKLPVNSLQFHQLDHGVYLLILTDEEAALRVYNGGHPL
jgi:hypothetical protein